MSIFRSNTLSKIVFVLAIVFLSGCNDIYTPKPRGYFRIDFPEKNYTVFDEEAYPYKFEIPAYAELLPDKSNTAQEYWADLNFTKYNAKVHITYFNLKDGAFDFYEDVRDLAMKHTSKADAIDEKVFENDIKKVYGILYDIKGNTASSVNFFLTDSTQNYLRGALYFNCRPNKDSLAPVIDYFKEDIIHLIETFEWKNKVDTKGQFLK